MGGGGFMMHAIKLLKANRSLMKGRSEVDHSLFHETSKIPLQYKEMSFEELERFKHLIKIKHQKENIKKFIIGVILSLSFISYSYWLLFM